MEKYLFENLPSYATDIVMKAKGETKSTVPATKLGMKRIKWNIDYRLVKIDELPSVGAGDASPNNDEEEEDPGPCPVFVFMPTKVQLIKMIIKAAYLEEI